MEQGGILKNCHAPLVGWSTSSPPTSLTDNTVTSPSKSVAGIVSDSVESLTTTVPNGGNSSPNKQRYPSNNNNCIENKLDENFPQIKESDETDKLAVITITEGVKFDILSKKDDSIISSADSEYGDNDDDDDECKNKIPDGGWGWMVVFASFVISMIADGVSFSFGLLYIEFLRYFRSSKSATAWIGSLFMAVPLMSGPICSALVDRYGCRWMTILGGIISGIGFIISSYVDSIFAMYITFGVISGIGLGLCYVTAVVSIAYWFDKKRTLATGLGACGTGIGTFVYAPMTQFFINEFGWRGTVLLLAGTFFNMCVCGALMKDPEWWKEEQKSSTTGKKSKGGSSCGSISGRSTGAESDFPGVEEIRNMLRSGETPEYILTALATYMKNDPSPVGALTDGDEKPITPFHSVVNLPTFIRQSEKVPLEVLESLTSNKKMFNVILENYPGLLLCRSISDHGRLNAHETVATHVPVTMSMQVKPTKKEQQQQAPAAVEDKAAQPLLPDEKVSSPPSPTKRYMKSGANGHQNHHPHHHHPNAPPRADSLPWLRRQFSMKENTHHYLRNIRMHRNSVMYRGAMLNIHKYRLRASSCPDIYRNSMTTIAIEAEETWHTELKELFRGMADFSMFLEWHFLLMSIATILLFIWFIVPYFYLAEHVTRHGFTETDASVILSAIGITNTIGMIGLGWAGDQPWMNVTKTYAVCLIACGFSTIGMPMFSDNYWMLMASSASFGIFFASNFSFTPVILVQLIPLERFTTAYGLTLLCQGIGNLLGPPLAGWLFDVTGSWDLSFYMAGVWIVVAGIFVALIPITENRRIWGSGMLEKDKDSVV